ncbi:hypothetical protein JHK82_055604 [Glycine max]|nr:hypothetical protein JHK86_055430 [Glycine max]KAG5076909.1 hypothetical protein JHK82_055604 [Glycine max]
METRFLRSLVSKQLSMKFHYTSVASFLFVTVILFPLVVADLSSDNQALLDFTNVVLHHRNLMWNPSTSHNLTFPSRLPWSGLYNRPQ